MKTSNQQTTVKHHSRILIVDDNAVHRKLMLEDTRRAGHNVKAVPDGMAAIEQIKEWHPSLVLLDVNMPGMDGYETLKQIRATEKTLYIPVLLVTGCTSIEEKREGFLAGADDFITKPYNKEELLLRIAAHLRRYRFSSEEDNYTPKSVVKVPIVLKSYKSGIFIRGFRISKRTFDILLSLLALPFALPVMAIIAVFIYASSPGSVLFNQKRTGMNGKRFTMYKFRTMVANAEELKEKYEYLNELSLPDFKISNDPRATKIGDLLRKTSLDELPQLINILLGNMSFVGPRPTSFEAETYELWQTERLEVRPGLTGLWQVSGRSDIDFIERVELDIEYIERQSWKLDLKIFWETIITVIQAKGAY